jgi:hypothetical protein
MTHVDYNIFYKTELPLGQPWPARWDVFVSAYNSSERVRLVFDKVTAKRKYWLMHREYQYTSADFPPGEIFMSTEDNEAIFIRALFDRIESDAVSSISKLSICIDLTGFMRPHLLFMALYLSVRGVSQYDVLYTEPERYTKKEKTVFSQGTINVRQVAGFEGVNSPNHADDFLVIGSGYDHRLIKAVAEHKDKADKVQIYGLPSLRADMYQENVLNALRAADAIGISRYFDPHGLFAPANDPFATASALSEIVERRSKIRPISNLYLSPLATKAQALGFALFYLGECNKSNASILFPISTQYARETSEGLSRVWMYTVEYPLI